MAIESINHSLGIVQSELDRKIAYLKIQAAKVGRTRRMFFRFGWKIRNFAHQVISPK